MAAAPRGRERRVLLGQRGFGLFLHRRRPRRWRVPGASWPVGHGWAGCRADAGGGRQADF
eukprot:4098335-Lingulodinium_polyedra.AAC.1